MSQDIRVRFKRAKRYPHPNGMKRQAGEEHSIPADLAERWEQFGIVERVDGKDGGGVVDLAAIPLANLGDALAGVSDAAVIRDALEADPRKGARAAYEARLTELDAE